MEIRHGDLPLAAREIALSGGRRIVEFDWQPRETYEFRVGNVRQTLRAPLRPKPYLVHAVPLEDVSSAAIGGVTPDAVVRFSPDGRKLAVGTYGGWLRIVDCRSGEELYRRRIAEGLVKTLAWSPDGGLLYFGEQSPDALLAALDCSTREGHAATYGVVWSARLADWIESSRPAAGDRYGIYSLPAVFDLKVAADGRVFAAGAHGWSIDGQPRNRSVVCCFDPAGAPLWRQPPDGAHPVVIRHLAIDADGNKLLLLANQTQPSTGAETLRPDTLYLLDGQTGQVAAESLLQPLRPHFDRVDAWDSVALSPAGERAAIGLGDGRGLLFDASAGLSPLVELDLATPVIVGATPIAAAASYTRSLGNVLVWQTQNTHIPFGSAQAANRAPAAHRGANVLTVTDLDGRALWKYRGPFSLTGAWCNAPAGNPRWLAAPCRELPGAAEAGQFGLLLFDLSSGAFNAARGGGERLTYYYPTTGPLAAGDVSADGQWLAIVETPLPAADGQHLDGTHHLHIVR